MSEVLLDFLGNSFIFLVFVLSGYYGKYLYSRYIFRKKALNWTYEFYSGFFWWNVFLIIPSLIIALFTTLIGAFVRIYLAISVTLIGLGFFTEIKEKEGFIWNVIGRIKNLKDISQLENLLFGFLIINLALMLTICLAHPIVAWDEAILWLPYARLFFESNGIPSTEDILAGYTTYHAVVPLLYAVPFFFFGSVNSFFRLIPLSFLIAILAMIYDVARKYTKNNNTGTFAVTAFISLTIIQYYMTLNTFYADLQTLFFFSFSIWSFIRGIDNQKKVWSLQSGISACIAVLSKFQGLAVFVVLFGVAIMFLNEKLRFVLALLGISTLLSVMIFFSRSIFTLNNIWGVGHIFLSGFTISAIVLIINWKLQSKKYVSFKIAAKYFLLTISIAILGLLWYLRAYLLTGNPFYPQGGNPWFTEIITKAWFAGGLYNKAFDFVSATTLPFLLLSYGGPLLLFKLWGIKNILSLKDASRNSLLAWIFWYQLTWITVFGTQNIRYNLYITPSLVLLIVLGINKMFECSNDRDNVLTAFFVGLLFMAIGYPWLPVFLGPVIPYAYPLQIYLLNLFGNIGYSLLATFVVLRLVNKKSFNSVLIFQVKHYLLKVRRHKLIIELIFLIYLNSMFTLYLPIMNFGGWVNYRTNTYPMNQYQLVYNAILKTTTEDDYILSFYTPGIYYFTGRRVINMGFYVDARLEKLRPLFNTGNMTFVLEYLKSLNIKDIVVLTTSSSLYNWYYQISNSGYFLKALRNSLLFNPILENDSLINNVYSVRENTTIYYGIFAVEVINTKCVSILGNSIVNHDITLGDEENIKLRLYYDFSMLNITANFPINITMEFNVKLEYKNHTSIFSDIENKLTNLTTSWGYVEPFLFNPYSIIKNYTKSSLKEITISIRKIKINLPALHEILTIMILPITNTNKISFNYNMNEWYIPAGSAYLFEKHII